VEEVLRIVVQHLLSPLPSTNCDSSVHLISIRRVGGARGAVDLDHVILPGLANHAAETALSSLWIE